MTKQQQDLLDVPAEYKDVSFSPLISTKFCIPGLPYNFLPRPHLSEQVTTKLKSKLLLISAPAGFGKTILMCEWFQTFPHGKPSLAWVTLDHADNHPQLFWAYVFTALEKCQAGCAQDALKVLQNQQEASLEAALKTLINTLAQCSEEIMLVLDNYHLITEQSTHASLLFLLEHAPAHLHLVLATRTDPPWPLARLRALGHMLEIRASQLFWTQEEIAAFFLQLRGEKLTNRAMQEITLHSEGWITGMQLMILACSECSNANGMIQEVQGNHRYILDYITDEILSQQTEEVQRFLLATSLLERFNAPLCDAILGSSCSQHILEYLEYSNLFLIALDAETGWYRYHKLFAQALSSHLQQTTPGMVVPRLHLRASRWSMEQGQKSMAIHYALKALKLLKPLLEQSEKQQRWDNVIEILILQALAYHMFQKKSQALLVLSRALALAESGGYVRLFMDEGSPMADLLAQLRGQAGSQRSYAYLETLLNAFPKHEKEGVWKKHTPAEEESFPQVLVECLSERELEVLQMVAQGASNQEIARGMVLSLNTVKRHVSNIMSKLGAANRTQAVAQARTLGIFPGEL